MIMMMMMTMVMVVAVAVGVMRMMVRRMMRMMTPKAAMPTVSLLLMPCCRGVETAVGPFHAVLLRVLMMVMN
jgi:hypothetical protein